MPKRTKKNISNNPPAKMITYDLTKDEVISDSATEDEDVQATFSTESEKNPEELHGNGRERPKLSSESSDCSENEPTRTGFCEEMHEMFESFSANLNKSLQTKKKRLEQLTEATLNTSTKKVEDFFKSETMDRCQLTQEFSNKMIKVLEQWDVEMQKVKEHEDKLHKLLLQQQKDTEQKFRFMNELLEDYMQASNKLQSIHDSKQMDIQNNLKKDLTSLQKKILMETEGQEMDNVRMSFFRAMYS